MRTFLLLSAGRLAIIGRTYVPLYSGTELSLARPAPVPGGKATTGGLREHGAFAEQKPHVPAYFMVQFPTVSPELPGMVSLVLMLSAAYRVASL